VLITHTLECKYFEYNTNIQSKIVNNNSCHRRVLCFIIYNNGHYNLFKCIIYKNRLYAWIIDISSFISNNLYRYEIKIKDTIISATLLPVNLNTTINYNNAPFQINLDKNDLNIEIQIRIIEQFTPSTLTFNSAKSINSNISDNSLKLNSNISDNSLKLNSNIVGWL
jgi:hypothetical protein